MIRLATSADVPRLIELGSLSLKNGPYKGKIADVPEQAKLLALTLLESGKVLVLVNPENQIVGLLALAFFPHYYTGEKTAAEVMWYVLPEWRKSLGLETIGLFRAAEREARAAGCTTIQFTAPTEEIARLYEKAGLTALEVAYYKELRPLLEPISA